MAKSRKNPIALYYCAHWLYQKGVPILPRVCQLLLYLLCHAVVPYRCRIGPDCQLAHGGTGVVFHPDVQIGRNVLIGIQVTIGGTGRSSATPVVGDDVYIGAGAKILGPISIGSNCVIGANAVVVKSVPSGCVVVGVPARVVKEGIDAHSIEQW